MLQVEALSVDKAGLLSQVAELQRVGEELSRSCAQLESSMQQVSAASFGMPFLWSPGVVPLLGRCIQRTVPDKPAWEWLLCSPHAWAAISSQALLR
jgi:hypothetical protein